MAVAVAVRREAGFEPTSTICARPDSSMCESGFGTPSSAVQKAIDGGLRAHRRSAVRTRRREGSMSPMSLLYKIPAGDHCLSPSFQYYDTGYGGLTLMTCTSKTRLPPYAPTNSVYLTDFKFLSFVL